MREFLYLVINDLRLEFRSKEAITVLLALSVILCTLAALGLASAFLSPEQTARIFPVLIWLIFIFVATTAIGHSFDQAFEAGALKGMLASNFSAQTIYAAKFSVNSLIIWANQILCLLILGGFLDLSLTNSFLELAALAGLVVLAYAALATLFSAITATSRLRGTLLPIILVPLLCPVFFIAVELTSQALSSQVQIWNSPWFTLLVMLDIVYFGLSFLLFDHVVRE